MIQHGEFDFDGATYDPNLDHHRLAKQLLRVFAVMRDGKWRTLEEVSTIVVAPEGSVSARLRDFRKDKFGGHEVERRRRGDEERGLWEYRVETNKGRAHELAIRRRE